MPPKRARAFAVRSGTGDLRAGIITRHRTKRAKGELTRVKTVHAGRVRAVLLAMGQARILRVICVGYEVLEPAWTQLR